MKFLIVGRTASGKDTLREVLERKYGWKFVKSYTTRQKRYPNEGTHVFVSKQEAADFSDKVAVTYFDNGNGLDEYFATRSQVEESDAYIVDPDGFRQVVEAMKGCTAFALVYVYPVSELSQIWHALRRNWRHVGSVLPRIASERDEFDTFESYITDSLFKSTTEQNDITCFVLFRNSYKYYDVENMAKQLNDIRSII